METPQEKVERKQNHILDMLSGVAITNDAWKVVMLVMQENIDLHADLLTDETVTDSVMMRRIGRYSALVEQKRYLEQLWEQAHKDMSL